MSGSNLTGKSKIQRRYAPIKLTLVERDSEVLKARLRPFAIELSVRFRIIVAA